MAMLLLRSLLVLVLFEGLGLLALLSDRGRRGPAAAAGFLAIVAGLAAWARSAEIGLLLGSAVVSGVVVSRTVRRGAGLWRAALVGLAPVVIASAVHVVGTNPSRSWQALRHEVEMLAAPPPSAPGGGAEERALAEKYRDLAARASTWTLRLLPAELVVFDLAQVLLLVAVAGRRARGAGGDGSGVPPLGRWRVPFGIVWFLALGLGLVGTRQDALVTAGMNVALVAAAVLSVQGLAVLVALLERSLPVVQVRWAILGLAAVTALPVLAATAAVLGTADLWLDFRRARPAAGDVS